LALVIVWYSGLGGFTFPGFAGLGHGVERAKDGALVFLGELHELLETSPVAARPGVGGRTVDNCRHTIFEQIKTGQL